jgi:hypothetical protein
LATPPSLAYIRRVILTRRHTRSVLRAVLPLLALVWASLPLHHCNLAFAGSPAESASAEVAPPGTAGATALAPRLQPSCHQAAEPAQPAESTVSCGDLGRVAPDLRPAVSVDTAFPYVSFDAHWNERAGQAVASFAGLRPRDDGRWRLRPLHLQKSVLLI